MVIISMVIIPIEVSSHRLIVMACLLSLTEISFRLRRKGCSICTGDRWVHDDGCMPLASDRARAFECLSVLWSALSEAALSPAFPKKPSLHFINTRVVPCRMFESLYQRQAAATASRSSTSCLDLLVLHKVLVLTYCDAPGEKNKYIYNVII